VSGVVSPSCLRRVSVASPSCLRRVGLCVVLCVMMCVMQCVVVSALSVRFSPAQPRDMVHRLYALLRPDEFRVSTAIGEVEF
jgi:hypothetical protein